MSCSDEKFLECELAGVTYSRGANALEARPHFVSESGSVFVCAQVSAFEARPRFKSIRARRVPVASHVT